jgi:hypothetical protein
MDLILSELSPCYSALWQSNWLCLMESDGMG